MTRQEAFAKALSDSYLELGAPITVIQFAHTVWPNEVAYNDNAYFPLSYDQVNVKHLARHRIVGAITSPDGINFAVTYTGGN